MEYHLAQKFLQPVTPQIENWNSVRLTKLPETVSTAFELLEGMNVRVEKKCRNFEILLQHLDGVNRAWTAAGMEEKFHNSDLIFLRVYIILVDLVVDDPQAGIQVF